MLNNKYAFLEALIMALFLFGAGFLFGIFFENNRSSEIQDLYYDFEITVSDVSSSLNVISSSDLNCDSFWSNLIYLNDKIYQTALKLEKYDNSNKITKELIALHKQYDLLRAVLWNQFIFAKKICGNKMNTIVYLYDYKNPTIQKKSVQGAFSNYLVNIDKKYPNDIVLIPIAADLNITTLDLLIKSYKINNYPVVILNEKYVFNDLDSLTKLEDTLRLNNVSVKKN